MWVVAPHFFPTSGGTVRPRNRFPVITLALALTWVLTACSSPKARPVGAFMSPGATGSPGDVTQTVVPAATPDATAGTFKNDPPPSPRTTARPTTTPATPATPATVGASPKSTGTPIPPAPGPGQTPADPSPTSTPEAPTAAAAAGLPYFSHVVIVLMENEEYGSIIGNPGAPYINSLASGGALAARYYAVSHPSLPNYLALTGGSTFGITNDCSPGPGCRVGATSVVEEMAAAGLSWKAYMENLPSSCAQSDSGRYAVRHDPFVYYSSVVAQSCGNVVPATQLPSDIATGALPPFAWLTPNLCNDMHDCSIATGDSYLSGVVPQILGALGPNGALFLVWDEGTSNTHGGGQVTMVAAGPAVKRGYRSSASYDHYSLLRTIEDAWGLHRLGNSAGAAPMTDLFLGN